MISDKNMEDKFNLYPQLLFSPIVDNFARDYHLHSKLIQNKCHGLSVLPQDFLIILLMLKLIWYYFNTVLKHQIEMVSFLLDVLSIYKLLPVIAK